MNSPIFPFQIAAVILAEALFGIGYNEFVKWTGEHHLWPTAISVVLGVMVTVLIPTVVWWRVQLDFWQFSALLTACFAASGLPMTIGSMRKKAEETHKRRPWPVAASQARDAAVMDLNLLAEQIAGKRIETAQVVNGLHKIIGILKSV